MKLSAVTPASSLATNRASSSKNNQNSPSFKATVRFKNDSVDEVWGEKVNLNQKPLVLVREWLQEFLPKLDDNLNITVSGTKRPGRFWSIDRYGLKFDINYIDEKKAYYDIMNNKNGELDVLDRDVIKGLKNKDETLLYHLGDKAKVGKLFRPEADEDIRDYKANIAKLINHTISRMPKMFMEQQSVEIDPKTGKYHTVMSADYGISNETYTIFGDAELPFGDPIVDPEY